MKELPEEEVSCFLLFERLGPNVWEGGKRNVSAVRPGRYKHMEVYYDAGNHGGLFVPGVLIMCIPLYERKLIKLCRTPVTAKCIDYIRHSCVERKRMPLYRYGWLLGGIMFIGMFLIILLIELPPRLVTAVKRLP